MGYVNVNIDLKLIQSLHQQCWWLGEFTTLSGLLDW